MPIRNPAARRTLASTETVVPFPFVPDTCIVLYALCGSSKSRNNLCMRPRSNPSVVSRPSVSRDAALFVIDEVPQRFVHRRECGRCAGSCARSVREREQILTELAVLARTRRASHGSDAPRRACEARSAVTRRASRRAAAKSASSRWLLAPLESCEE